MKGISIVKTWKKPLPNKSAQAGFTLLETLIALTIMLVAFTAILSVESTSITATERAKQMNIVAMLAKNQMTQVEYEFEGKTFDEYKKEDAGTFAAPYEQYRWTTKIKEVKFPNFDFGGGKAGGGEEGAGGAADGGDMGAFLVKLVSKYLSKALREVNLTVYWKRGKGEQSFTVSTYWVNLNNEFALSE